MTGNLPSFRQISYFITMAQTLHFGKAALDIHVPEPVLSREIKKLETILGCRLFDRSNRRAITLTPAGEAYFEQVRHIPSQLFDGQQAARFAEKTLHGKLNVTAALNISLLCPFEALFEKFITIDPNIQFNYRTQITNPETLQDIRDGKTDIGFFAADSNLTRLEGVQYIELIRSRPVAVVPKTSPLASKKIIHLADIRNETLILSDKEERRWLAADLIKEYLAIMPKTLPHVYEATGMWIPLLYAASGLGLALFFPVDETIIAPSIMKRIAFRPIAEAKPLPILAGYLEENTNPLLEKFLAHIKKNLDDIRKPLRQIRDER